MDPRICRLRRSLNCASVACTKGAYDECEIEQSNNLNNRTFLYGKLHGKVMNAARQSCERAWLRSWLPVALIAAGVVWAVGLATPWGAAQRHAFFEDGTRWFCDYGFPRECAAAEQTYVPVDFEAKEACYPPLGYPMI